RGRQRHEFGHAQTGRVENFEQAIEPRSPQPLRDCAVTLDCLVRGREQLIDMADGEHLRQSAAALRSLDRGGWIVLAISFGVEEPIELADRRKASRTDAAEKPRPLSRPR